MRYWAVDVLGNTENVHTDTFRMDSTSPTTMLLCDGDSYEDTELWISQETHLALESTDGAGAGILYTKYKVDNKGWKNYLEPFTLSTEGEHILQF